MYQIDDWICYQFGERCVGRFHIQPRMQLWNQLEAQYYRRLICPSFDSLYWVFEKLRRNYETN